MRIFRRPMFRRGGSTGQGIMTGLEDRRRYNEGTTREEILAKRYQKIMGQPDFNQLLVSGGLGLVSGQGATGEGTLADVATAFKGPTDQFFQQAMANKAAAKKMAIQQAGQEELYSMKNDPAAKRNQALYNVFLEKGIEDGFSGAEAQRFAEYHTTGKEKLRKEVGDNRIGGVLDFDPNNVEEVKKRRKRLSEKTGYYFYDPRDGKYKKLIQDQHGNLNWEIFSSIEEIRFEPPTSDKPIEVPAQESYPEIMPTMA